MAASRHHRGNRFSAHVGEMAALIPITRAHGLEHVAAARVDRVTEQVRASGVALDLLNGRFTAVSWITLQRTASQRSAVPT